MLWKVCLCCVSHAEQLPLQGLDPTWFPLPATKLQHKKNLMTPALCSSHKDWLALCPKWNEIQCCSGTVWPFPFSGYWVSFEFQPFPCCFLALFSASWQMFALHGNPPHLRCLLLPSPHICSWHHCRWGSRGGQHPAHSGDFGMLQTSMLFACSQVIHTEFLSHD